MQTQAINQRYKWQKGQTISKRGRENYHGQIVMTLRSSNPFHLRRWRKMTPLCQSMSIVMNLSGQDFFDGQIYITYALLILTKRYEVGLF